METEAEPSCFAKSAFMPGDVELIRYPSSLLLLGASCKPLSIYGVVNLSIRVGRHIVSAQLLVCDTLQVEYILGIH